MNENKITRDDVMLYLEMAASYYAGSKEVKGRDVIQYISELEQSLVRLALKVAGGSS